MSIITPSICLKSYKVGEGDCFLLSFNGKSGSKHNIVIDTGPSHSCMEFLKMYEEIVQKKECIDILIITHWDDDHLGGILRAFSQCRVESIKELWINYKETGCAVNLSGSLDVMDALLSARQNRRLVQEALRQGISVRNRITAGMVVELDGAVIRIIAPSEKRLKEFWQDTTQSKDIKQFPKQIAYDALLAHRSDYGKNLSELMEAALSYRDRSRSNGASIAFIFELPSDFCKLHCPTTRILFTGDAPAEAICDGIAELLEEEKICDGFAESSESAPIYFDWIKLPHHGSCGNISEEWPKYIRCRNYIISTDGVRHPDKQTIAKLLKWNLKRNENLEIYGNYSWWRDGFLAEEDKEKYLRTGKLRFYEFDKI